MALYRPVSDNPFSSPDFPHLSDAFVRWFWSIASPPEADDERYGRESATRLEAVRTALNKLDYIQAQIDVGDQAMRTIALVVDAPEVRNLDTPELRRARREIEWTEARSDPRFPQALTVLFQRGHIGRVLQQENVPEPIRSWFRELALPERLEFYIGSNVPEETVRILEALPANLADPLVLSILRFVDKPLFNALLNPDAKELSELISCTDKSQLPIRAWACLKFRKPSFIEAFAGFESLDLLRLLANLTALQHLPAHRSSNEIPQTGKYRVDDAIGGLREAANGDQEVVQAVQDTLAGKVADEGISELDVILEWFFGLENREAKGSIRPNGEDDEHYWRLVDALSEAIGDETSLPTISLWIRERNRENAIIDVAPGLCTDVLGSTLDEVIVAGEAALPLVWLWVNGTDWYGSDEDLDAWMDELIESADEAPGSMRSILTLGMDSWTDPSMHVTWVEYVVDRFVETVARGTASDDDGDNVTKYVVDFAESAEYRDRFKVFRNCEILLTQYLEDEQSPRIPRLTVALLVAAALGDQSARDAVDRSDDPRATLFGSIIGASDVDLNDAWRRLAQSDEVLSVPSVLWLSAGIAREEVVRTSLESEVRRAWPDVTMGIARWEHYCGTAVFEKVDPELLQLGLNLARNGEIPDDLEPFVSIGLLAEQARMATPVVIEDNELAQHALSILHGLRRQIRDGSSENSPEFHSAADAAIVAGAVLGWWKALKPLLLAFRQLSVTVVGPDLAPMDIKSTPAAKIPRAVSHLLRVEHRTEELHDLRRSLAMDLLDRLKPSKGNAGSREIRPPSHNYEGFDPGRIEPDPVWRTAYVRAIGDLAVKMTEKGHSVVPVLNRVADNDPAPIVQEATQEVLHDIQRLRKGWGSGSHKRLLFHAWWWLRQAHRVSLDAEIVEQEANRVRNTEFR